MKRNTTSHIRFSDADDLSRRITLLRKHAGYTQEYVSVRLHISRQAYSNYERGVRTPSIDLISRLCQLYGISLDQMIP